MGRMTLSCTCSDQLLTALRLPHLDLCVQESTPFWDWSSHVLLACVCTSACGLCWVSLHCYVAGSPDHLLLSLCCFLMQNKTVMGLGIILMGGCVGYLAYMNLFFTREPELSPEKLKNRRSKWDWVWLIAMLADPPLPPFSSTILLTWLLSPTCFLRSSVDFLPQARKKGVQNRQDIYFIQTIHVFSFFVFLSPLLLSCLFYSLSLY